ncbi:fatty acid synthase alpha subunit Lsd1, partial [Coemansia sp. RSA 988]
MITIVSDDGSITCIADVDYEWDTSHGNPVLEYLRTFELVSETFWFEDDGYQVSPNSVDDTTIVVPNTNIEYARISSDMNPIHSTAARSVWDHADKYMLRSFGIPLLHIVRTNPTEHFVYFEDEAGEAIRDRYTTLMLPHAENDSDRSFSAVTSDSFSHRLPALVAYALAVVADMRSKSLVPKNCVFAGHSLGEICSLAALGDILSLEDAIDIAFCRGLIMQSAIVRDGQGRSEFGMVAVDPSRCYIPNLTGKPFELSKEYITLVANITNSAVLVELLGAWDSATLENSADKSRVAAILLIELLSYQLASPPIDDVGLQAIDIIHAIVAFKMKQSLISISTKQSIKTLVGGKSILQNEIVGDIQKEFGNHVPDKPEEISLQELGSAPLVTRLFSSKMPGGFSLTNARAMLQSAYGLGPQRQDALLLVALTMEPSTRLASEAEASGWLGSVAQTYAAQAGI